MSFMDRAKAAAEQARIRAQEGLGEVQAKKETAQAYWDLGHKAYELAAAGTITHPELDPLVARISELEGTGGTPSAGASPATSEQATETPPPPESGLGSEGGGGGSTGI